MSTQTISEKKLKHCLQNKSLPRLARGFSLLSAYEKSHHENVMAKFNFTANFARPRGVFYLSKDFFRESSALCEQGTDQNDDCGNCRNQSRDLNNRHPTALVCDRAERVGTANRARVATSVKQSGDTADVAVFADAEGDQARRDVDDTAHHQVHNREEEERDCRISLLIEQNDREDRSACNRKQQAFQEEVALNTLLEPFDKECAKQGDLGQNHRQEDGQGFLQAEILLQNGGEPRNDTVTDENGASRTHAGEDEYENKVRCEQGNLALYGSSLGSRLGSCVLLDLCAVMMELIFRATNTEEPSQTDREHGSERKEEYRAPGNTKLIQERGHTVADKGTDAVGHAVPDDTASDIFACQKHRLNIEDIAPKHTLGKTVDEPDIFHGLNGRRKRNTEITKR